MAEIRFVAQVGSEIGHILHRCPLAIGGNVGEGLLDACRDIQLVGQRDRDASAWTPLVGQATRTGKIDRQRERVTVHEHGILLAHAKIAEINEGEPQPERVASASHRLRRAVEKVGFDECVNIPIEKGGRRPGVQADPAITGGEVIVLPVLLRYRNGIGDEVVAASNWVEVVQAGQSNEPPEAERGVGSRYQVGARKQPTSDKLLTLLRCDRNGGGDRSELGDSRRLAFIAFPRLVPWRSIIGQRPRTDPWPVVLAELIEVVRHKV